jgi:hypothetical protein
VGPCHTALYKGGGGHRLASRGSPPATHPPPTFPSPIYRERSSDGKLRRRRHFLDRRCPSADLHFASLPSRRSPTWLAVPAAPLLETVHLSSPLSLHSCITYVHSHSYSWYPARSAPSRSYIPIRIHCRATEVWELPLSSTSAPENKVRKARRRSAA